MSAELNALLNGKTAHARKKCRSCGQERTVQVVTRISRVDDGGKNIKGQSVTMAAQFCDDHGMEAFTTARKAIGR